MMYGQLTMIPESELKEALTILNPRERIVFELQNGLGDNYTYSDEEIARILQIQRMETVDGLAVAARTKLGSLFLQRLNHRGVRWGE